MRKNKSPQPNQGEKIKPWQNTIHEIIFEADTKWGKIFDISLLILIFFSVVIVSLESISEFEAEYSNELRAMEWALTIIFTVEYILRLISVLKPWKYASSFFGIIDLLSILPTYLSLLFGGTQALLVIRVLRLLRIFRVLKLARYLGQGRQLANALKASRFKITVFLVTILCLVLIMGSIMYLVEGKDNGFTSIPRSVYWAIVTLSTVGYGDVAPQTVLGQMIASVIMIMGYGIIAVPTGIVSVELANAQKMDISTQACPSCSKEGHDVDAVYCKFCGTEL